MIAAFTRYWNVELLALTTISVFDHGYVCRISIFVIGHYFIMLNECLSLCKNSWMLFLRNGLFWHLTLPSTCHLSTLLLRVLAHRCVTVRVCVCRCVNLSVDTGVFQLRNKYIGVTGDGRLYDHLLPRCCAPTENAELQVAATVLRNDWSQVRRLC